MSISLLEQYIEDTGLSQAAVAKQLVKSATTINQYLKGTYKGDVDAIDAAVVELVSRHQTRASDSDFVQTASVTRILEVCDMAHRMSCKVHYAKCFGKNPLLGIMLTCLYQSF